MLEIMSILQGYHTASIKLQSKFKYNTLLQYVQSVSTTQMIMLQGSMASEPVADGGTRVESEGCWIQVLDKEQGRHLGGSGMAFQ